MRRSVWKYEIFPGPFALEMPGGSQLLDAQVQNNVPRLWALVNPDAPMESRSFYITGTGHEIPDDVGHYVGTFQMDGGALVFHLFAEEA